MALHDILHWKAPDSTQDLNARTRGTRRSIFPTAQGVGLVTPSAISLNVTIQPFLAQGFDGLSVLSDSVITSTMPVPPAGPPQTYWLTLYVRYQLMQPAIIQVSFVPDNTILTALDREYYVRFAKVTVATGTTNAAAATWDFSVGDHSAQLGGSRWRDPVATAAALPLPPSYNGASPNHDGDVRVTLDTHFSYVWSTATATWSVVSGAGALTSATSRSNELDRKIQRSNEGTGFLGLGHNEAAYADALGAIGAGFQVGDGPIVNSTPSAFNLRVAPFQMAVNGHKIAISDVTIPLPAPPGITTRYDLVYLEVYRSRINTPIGGIVYDNNLAGTYTFAQVETLIEQIVNEDPYFGSSNFNFGGVELADDGSVVVTLWKWSVQSGITYTGPTAANYVVTQASPVTVPGFFATTYAASAHNSRIGIATNNALAPGVWDGTAYGVPVFVVRRNVLEASYTASRTVVGDLSGCTIWSVLPMADTETGRPQVRRLLQDAAATSRLAPGVLKGYTTDLTWANGGGAGPLNFTVPAETLVLTFPEGQYASAFPADAGIEIDSSQQAITAPVPPVAGARRDLLALLYWLSPSALLLQNSGGKAFMKGVQLLDVVPQGGRTLYAYGIYRFMSVGTATDETDAFVAASLPFYETGGAVPFAPVAGDQHPGLWVATPTGSALNEHGIDRVFAMPVAVLHRRNSATYSDALVSTNFNGSSTGGSPRPEEQYAGIPAAAYDLMPREVVDLRHATGMDLDVALSESMSHLTRGTLATRLQRNPLDATVAGTSHLAVDIIGDPAPLGLSPTSNVVLGADLDGLRHSFTDAQELQVIGWTTDSLPTTVALAADVVIPSSGTASFNYGSGTWYDYIQRKALQDPGGFPIFQVTYNSATLKTTLYIRSPKNSYLHSSMRAPQDFTVNTPVVGPSVNFQQLGLVTFAHIHGTISGIGTPRNTLVRNKTVHNGVIVDARTSYNALHDAALTVTSFTVRAVDAIGRPTAVEIEFPYTDDPGDTTAASSSGLASIQVVAAFQYDKPKTANKLRTDYNTYGLTVDGRVTGLSLAPKRIYKIDGKIRNTTYTDISVGALYKTISRPCTGTTQVTISPADFPGENNIKIYGLLGNPLVPGGGTQKVRALESGASFPNTTLTVTFNAALPLAGNVTMKVAYTSDERKYWVEALKTNRGIVGPFTWESEEHVLSNLGASQTNARTGVNERFYVCGVQHPTQPENRFTIGLPNGLNAAIVCENQALFGWFSRNAGLYYTTNDPTWYAAPKIAPWLNISGGAGFGRTTDVTGNLPLLGATAGYYDTFGGAASPSLVDPAADASVLVYATPIPLDGSVGDHLVVLYEGHAYQGVMGDNDTLANRLSRLQGAVVPPTVGDDLIYDAVSDVYVTTAGTGLPYMDGRHFGIQSFGYTAGVANNGARWTFYSPDVAKDNGVSNAYRQTKLSSERLRQMHSAADTAYTFPDDDSDLLMHFVPGPATQYCPSPNASGIDIGSYAGVGPGTMSDYDHSTLTDTLVVTELLSTARANYQRSPSVTIKVPASDGYAPIRIPYTTPFSAYWTETGAPGMAHGDHDLLLNATAGDFWHVGTIQKLGNLPPVGRSPEAGFRLRRTISGGDITVLTNKLDTFTTFAAETVGKPHAALLTQARGTQGYPTFRPGYPGAVALTEATWLGRPSENLLSGCAHDANLLAASSIGEFLLSESSSSFSHQQAGNPFLATQGNYYEQVRADYSSYPIGNHFLMPQKFWAFRGSAINRAGQVRLLINAGFGSNMLVGDQNSRVRSGGHRAHLGFSADAFDLLHRPVRRP